MDAHEKTKADYWSADEVREHLSEMSETDLLRIQLMSDALAYRDISPEELQQEAFRRALEVEAGRRWPKHVPLAAFMYQSMRSIMSSLAGAASRRMEVNEAEGGLILADLSEGAVSSCEGSMLEEDEAARIKQRVLEVFHDDETAQLILEGKMADMKGKELCELASISGDELATVNRRIKRGLARAFPKGWSA